MKITMVLTVKALAVSKDRRKGAMRCSTRVLACALLAISGSLSAISLDAQRPVSALPITTAAVSSSKFLDAQNGVTLDQLLRVALTRNGDLLATRQRILEAQGLLRQAGVRPNPVIESEFGSGSATGSPGEREFSVGYAHAFELGGKRARRVDVGTIDLDLASLEVTDRERALRADLQERYIAAIAAIRDLETVEQQLDVTQQSYLVTERRVAEGESPRVDEVALQAEVGRLGADRLLLASDVEQAMLDLRVVAGLELSEPLRLRPDGDLTPIALTLEAALERGVAGRPDLVAARREEAREAAEVRLAQAERLPDASTLIRYTDTQSRFDLFGFTAGGALAPVRDRDRVLTGGLSISLPVLARNQGQIDAARARQTAASLRLDYLERTIRAEITGAFGRYLAARQAVQLFETAVIQPSEESVRVLRASYAAGEVRLFDVLTEQRRLIETQKAYTDARRHEALARVTLERAIGAPLQ